MALSKRRRGKNFPPSGRETGPGGEPEIDGLFTQLHEGKSSSDLIVSFS